MGYDRYYTIYHLMPDGFVRGPEADDDHPADIGPIPNDRIETWLQLAESHDTWEKRIILANSSGRRPIIRRRNESSYGQNFGYRSHCER
jgi:hypothetical protein